MAATDTPLPGMWEVLEKEGPDTGLSGFLNIWSNRLRSSKASTDTRPLLVLGVTFAKMTNLVPQDAPHPLYSAEYLKLTDEFILDHLCLEKVEGEEALEAEGGVTLKTLSGKEIVLKREDGKTTANGIEVECQQSLTDGTDTLVLKDFLFNHLEDTRKAFKQFSQDITHEFCPLSQS